MQERTKLNKKDWLIIVMGALAAYYLPKVSDYLLANLPAMLNWVAQNIVGIAITVGVIYLIKKQQK